MYQERYEVIKHAVNSGADIAPIDGSFMHWYEHEMGLPPVYVTKGSGMFILLDCPSCNRQLTVKVALEHRR